MMHDGFSDNRRAVIVTVLFHGALLLMLLAIPVRFRMEEPPRLYELSLMAVSPAPGKQAGDAARQPETRVKPVARVEPSRERVEIPRRLMTEPEKPALTVPEASRTGIRKNVPATEKPMREESSARVETAPVAPETATPEPAKASEQPKSVSENIPDGSGSGAGSESNSGDAGATGGFRIEGDITGRSVIYNPLPSYPEGLNRNATIRISFTVLPNGSVSPMGMVPIRKENAVLEELSMSMLKRWRFSPLPSGDTRNQRGIITFYYKVR